jgi:hypothetical protein
MRSVLPVSIKKASLFNRSKFQGPAHYELALFTFTGGILRYPNLRYGNPTEMAHYAMQFSIKDLAKLLRRDERTVRDWLSCRARVPWWVPELLRLRHMEAVARHRQMGMGVLSAKLGFVTGDVITLAERRPAAPAELRPQTGPADLSEQKQNFG